MSRLAVAGADATPDLISNGAIQSDGRASGRGFAADNSIRSPDDSTAYLSHPPCSWQGQRFSGKPGFRAGAAG